MVKFRGFISIDLKPNQKIKKIIEELDKSEANLKIVSPEKMHITLKFLGDTEEKLIPKIEEIIKNTVEEIEPFEIKIKKTGAFPNLNYMKVLWIGIEKGEQIGIIAKKIDEGLTKIGFKKEKRGFSPHITIARVKSGKNKDIILKILNKYKNEEFINLKVDKVSLKKSELTPKGPIYTTLKEIDI